MAKQVSSLAELEAAINAALNDGVKAVAEEAKKEVDRFLQQYYGEFSPTLYTRTNQLLKSCITESIGDGQARVYIDVGSLDYTMKTINGYTFPNRGWDAMKTVQSADSGGHGGVPVGGTNIWQDPMDILLGGKLLELFKEHMAAKGFTIA